MALLDFIREILSEQQPRKELPIIPYVRKEPVVQENLPAIDESPYFKTFPVGKELPAIPPVQNDTPTRPRIALPTIPPLTSENTAPGIGQDLPVIDDALELNRPSELELARQEVSKLLNQKAVDNDKSGWKKLGAFGREALTGAREASIAKGGNADVWDLLGGATGGAGRYAIDPAVDERRTLDKNREEALKKYQIQAGMDQFATNQANIQTDNELAAQKQKDKVEQGKIEANRKAKKDFTDRVWSKQKYWKADKANAIDRAELAQLGLKPEDIADFDFRDPKTKQIGGVTYQWNAQTQSFDESNLPKDGSKEIVSYDVTDADGVKRTFRTTSDKAASLVTSTKNAQMQIEAAAQRQESQQNFTLKRDELDRKAAKELVDYKAAIAEAQNEKDEERKKAAETRAEESRRRLMQYQSELKILEDQ